MPVQKCLALILGGGRGTRLYPLTKERCKPAIGFAGKYRLIDIPISNCIHSGIKNIFVLTQFLTESLHRHIFQTYRFDMFSGGFVRVLPAEQTHFHESWFQGTADAVRQSIRHLRELPINEIIILSGDHLYKMDYNHIVRFHRKHNADATIASVPISGSEIQRMGILKTNEDFQLIGMQEKPKSPDLIKGHKLTHQKKKYLGLNDKKDYYLASMGIYVFKKEILIEILQKSNEQDFGKQIIPWSVSRYNCYSYPFNGFWEDIGTIKTYYEENLNLNSKNARYKLIDENWPLFTHPRFLPPSKIIQATVKDCLISEGCILDKCDLQNSIIGNRSVIHEGTVIKDSVLEGNDQYHFISKNKRRKVFIGKNVTIERAIIDKNVSIGNSCVISSKKNQDDYEGQLHYIKDGITIIPRGTIIPSGTKI